MEITREVFEKQRRPRFGKGNPERMQVPFWEWMIRGPDTLVKKGEGPLGEFGGMIRAGKIKSTYGPWRACDLFNIPLNREEGAIWTFDRSGATRTELQEGRVVFVGGEHEDFYEPDFYIYNDVVVFGPGDEIEIYGYPRDVFPPTDFHTATLVGDRIVLIGCTGYVEDRRPGHTPVYELDLASYRMSRIESSGDLPGWVSEHEAELGPTGTIVIRGGRVFTDIGVKQRFRRNVDDYALDVDSAIWRRITNRNWRQFSIEQEDERPFVLEPTAEAILPRDMDYSVLPSEDPDAAFIVVQGIAVSVTVDICEIAIVVQGDLPGDLLLRLVENMRSNAEKAIQRRCVLQKL